MKERALVLSGIVAAATISCGAPERPRARHLEVPELVSARGHWMNQNERLTLEQLQGKVVWLQFNF